jgi:chromosome segregation protein
VAAPSDGSRRAVCQGAVGARRAGGKDPRARGGARNAQDVLSGARDAIAAAEQTFRLEQAQVAHAARTLDGLHARVERLEAERGELAEPDSARLESVARAIAATESDAAACAGRIRELQQDLPVLEAARAAALARLQELEREANTRAGRLATLKRIQAQVEEGSEIADWLARHSLERLPRLWQMITVEPGWETAIESVLRERLHALQLADREVLARLLDDPPPAKVSLFTPSTAPSPPGPEFSFRPLGSLIRFVDDTARPLVEEWLAGCFAIDGAPPLTTRLGLASGTILVNREGHQFGRYAVSFHGPDSIDAGILARQREIERLTDEVQGFSARTDEAREVHAAAERQLAARREQVSALQDRESELNQKRHEQQLEHLRLTEAIARIRARAQQIGEELAEIERQEAQERAARAEAESRLDGHRLEITRRSSEFQAAQSEHEASQAALEDHRQAGSSPPGGSGSGVL